jgi:transcription elongation factor
MAYLNLKDSDNNAFRSVLNSYRKFITINPDSLNYVAVDERPYDEFAELIKDIKDLKIQ